MRIMPGMGVLMDRARSNSAVSNFQRYILAALPVIAAFLLQQELLHRFRITLPPFFLFYPVFVVIARQLGLWPGLFSLALSSIFAGKMITEKVAGRGASSLSYTVSLTLFVCIGVFLCIMMERIRGKEQKMVELEKKKALRESENLLQLFIDHAPASVMVIMFDAEMRCRAVSESWAKDIAFRINGLGKEQLIGRSHYEVFPELPELYKDAHRRGLQGEFVRCTEDRYIKKDGREHWTSWEVVPWFKGNGQVGGIIIISQDITERKQAEEALRESKNLLQLFVEYAPASLAMFDCEMRYLAATRRYLEECSLVGREIAGHCVYEILPDLPEARKEAHRRALAGEVVRHDGDRYQRADGTEGRMRSEVRPWLKGDGVIGGVVISAEDITERKQAEESLRASETRYRTAFQTSLDAMCIARRSDGMFIDFNSTFCDLTGFAPEDLAGHTTLEVGFWGNRSDRESWIESVRRQKNVRDFQAEFRKKNGETFWGLMSGSSIELDGEECTLAVIRDLTETRRDQAEIHNLAFYDSLTGLPNRRLFVEQLQKSMASSARNGKNGALLFIDLDDFTILNDTLGHQAGDEVLRILGKRLSGSVRQVDSVSRLCGDEFGVLLVDLSADAREAAIQARRVAQKIMTEMSRPLKIEGHKPICSCSIGITVFSDHEITTNDILQQADIAIHKAKQTGRKSISIFSQVLKSSVDARAAIEGDLRRGISKNEFALYYQPQIQVGQVVGVEALLRWNHPQRGLLAPAEFITEAEETGQILPLGKWALESACEQIAAWADSPLTSAITVAVNISAKQVRSKSFVSSVMKALNRSGANPHNLELELTETMLFEDVEDLIAKMAVLKAYGVSFSIDDFGTGYSSLAYLKHFPLDRLKIDRSFVSDLPDSASSRAIAQAIVSLGDALGLSVIAEGVETERQQQILAELGCNAYQGYLFSKPLPVEQLELSLLTFSEAGLFIQKGQQFSLHVQ